jgi:hypothetical protein
MRLRRNLAIALVLGCAPLALATRAVPAHAQGEQPISACTTIDTPGSYALANDLSGTTLGDHDCIDIGVPGVALDLAGHKITGPGTGGAGSGIMVSSAGVGDVVTNSVGQANSGTGCNTGSSATISGFGGDGIEDFAKNSTIEYLTFSTNGNAGLGLDGSGAAADCDDALSSPYGIVVGCGADGNTVDSVDAQAESIAGFAVLCGRGNIFRNDQAVNTTTDGFLLEAGSTGNVITHTSESAGSGTLTYGVEIQSGATGNSISDGNWVNTASGSVDENADCGAPTSVPNTWVENFGAENQHVSATCMS